METPEWLKDNVNSRRGKASDDAKPKPDTTGAEMRDGEWVVNIFDRAQVIFGHIITEAYQIVGDYDKSFSPYHSASRVRSILNGKPDYIDLEYGRVIVKFASGAIVSFHTSEWGGIQEASKYD